MNYVANTVDGFVSSATHPDAVGQTFNFGSGREISIGDLAALIVRLAGSASEIAPVEAERLRPAGSEVERLLASYEKAQSKLGWTPKVSMEQGLTRTIEWFAANAAAYRTGEYTV
jgi:dTDP-glucose 4,6-dehydratase